MRLLKKLIGKNTKKTGTAYLAREIAPGLTIVEYRGDPPNIYFGVDMGIFNRPKPTDPTTLAKPEMLTANFSRAEMQCKCGDNCGAEMDPEFMAQLQCLRDRYGTPLKVTSGARCPVHNHRVGGARESFHVSKDERKARAADIRVEDTTARYKLVALAIGMGFNGIGISSTYIHLDNRPSPKMWHYKD